jgi:hypothetical protein
MGQIHNYGQFLHLGGGFEILLAGKAAHPAWVAEQLAIGNAHTRLMRFKIALGEKAHIVGRHHRHLQTHGQRHGRGDQRFLPLAPDPAHLEVVAITEQAAPKLEVPLGVAALAARQREVDALTKKVSALESQVTSLNERVQSAQSSKVAAGNQSAMTYQQRVAAQPYRDESPRYSEQPGRSYDHRGYYREQRSPQGPYATYRPDGSEDTGFDR